MNVYRDMCISQISTALFPFFFFFFSLFFRLLNLLNVLFSTFFFFKQKSTSLARNSSFNSFNSFNSIRSIQSMCYGSDFWLKDARSKKLKLNLWNVCEYEERDDARRIQYIDIIKFVEVSEDSLMILKTKNS